MAGSKTARIRRHLLTEKFTHSEQWGFEEVVGDARSGGCKVTGRVGKRSGVLTCSAVSQGLCLGPMTLLDDR